MKNSINVGHYIFGAGALVQLASLLDQKRREGTSTCCIYFIDAFFEGSSIIQRLPIEPQDRVLYVDTTHEPKTTDIDKYRDDICQRYEIHPCAMIGIGGGTTLDVCKAVANLLTNDGQAADYQGWDLVQNPAVYKIGIPTLSGTGAEASRTCVMTNPETGIKLGMNSDATVFDQLILDPELTETVPREQYFYTGMDTYIHCIESLDGEYRNAIGDAFSKQAITLCREVFQSEDMMSLENRGKMMVASYLGGCAIANSYVGVIHPFSAGLSVVLGVHHCIGNCITMLGMQEFYPAQYDEFFSFAQRQGIEIKPLGGTMNSELSERLYSSTIVHEKPLQNALGEDFKEILSYQRATDIFEKMI